MADANRRPHNWFLNPLTKRWEIRLHKVGNPAMSIGPDGALVDKTATIQNANIGTLLSVAGMAVGGATTLTRIYKAVGSTAAVTAIGTETTAVLTIGSTANLPVAVADFVQVTPKAAIGGRLGIAYVRVPTTSVLNIGIINPDSQGGGSIAALGWDVSIIR